MNRTEFDLQWSDVSHLSEHDHRSIAKSPTGGTYIVASDEADKSFDAFYMDAQLRTRRVGFAYTVDAARGQCQEHLNRVTDPLNGFLKELGALSDKYGVVIEGCGCCRSPELIMATRAVTYEYDYDEYGLGPRLSHNQGN